MSLVLPVGFLCVEHHPGYEIGFKRPRDSEVLPFWQDN